MSCERTTKNEKIIIIGSGGSGKSTFAVELGKKLNLPVIHLDREFWKSDWVKPKAKEWLEKLEVLLSESRWIAEGNYLNSLEYRIGKADSVIFLDFKRSICIYRVIKRYFIHRGTTRPDMAEGCNEQIDMDFAKWLWEFPKKVRPQMIEILTKYPEKNIIILKNAKDVNLFLNREKRV